jgi:hypothetical protein
MHGATHIKTIIEVWNILTYGNKLCYGHNHKDETSREPY